MINRILVAGAAAFGLVCFSATAQAQEKMSAEAFMKAVNTNADKTISKKELEVFAKKRFAEIESDHDKTLDDKELKGRLSAAGMAMADTDKDKTVDESEFVGYADKLFDQANANADKTLSIKELNSEGGKKLRMLLQ